MKRKFLTVITVILSLSAFSQQIPNGGFESWSTVMTYEDPADWASFNFYTLLGANETAIKTTDAHSGTYALNLQSSVSDIGNDGEMDTLFGYATLGSASFNSEQTGIPFSYRPDSLVGWYKLISPENTPFMILAELIVSDTWETVGVALFNGDAQSEYTRFSVPVTYVSGSTPDTLFLTVINTDNESVTTNSLFIDDLEFTYPSVASLEENTFDLDIYPNPAGEILYLRSETALTSVEITDVNGKLLLKIDAPNSFQEIDLTGIDNGVLFCKTVSLDERSVRIDKIIKTIR